MNTDAEKIELLIVMAERLNQAIEADIVALKAGQPQAMRTLDPEVQRLSIEYGREAQSFDISRTKAAAPELRKRFLQTTGKFRDSLKLHARLLTRMRNASEGLVHAIANEVERRHQAQRPYAPPKAQHTKPPVAMVFNGVI